jgi:hypothetical protein
MEIGESLAALGNGIANQDDYRALTVRKVNLRWRCGCDPAARAGSFASIAAATKVAEEVESMLASRGADSLAEERSRGSHHPSGCRSPSTHNLPSPDHRF